MIEHMEILNTFENVLTGSKTMNGFSSPWDFKVNINYFWDIEYETLQIIS